MIKTKKLTFAAIAFSLALAGCGVQQQEMERTRDNRVAINSAIPVPNLLFSIRRWVLSRFYQSLERPRLLSCTVITSRGGDKTELAIAPTYGTAVNLSNQMTEPGMSEPDSIYVGQNDQTVVVLRNGTGIVTEGDTSTVLGDCPTNVEKPKTALQAIVDHQMEGKPQFDFLPATSAGKN